jgi:hypothetical protein
MSLDAIVALYSNFSISDVYVACTCDSNGLGWMDDIRERENKFFCAEFSTLS